MTATAGCLDPRRRHRRDHDHLHRRGQVATTKDPVDRVTEFTYDLAGRPRPPTNPATASRNTPTTTPVGSRRPRPPGPRDQDHLRRRLRTSRASRTRSSDDLRYETTTSPTGLQGHGRHIGVTLTATTATDGSRRSQPRTRDDDERPTSPAGPSAEITSITWVTRRLRLRFRRSPRLDRDALGNAELRTYDPAGRLRPPSAAWTSPRPLRL